jgi:hypothetical protein
MESDAGLVQGHGMHTRLPPCAPGYGMTRVQERASQRNLSKACQQEGDGICHVLSGLEGRVEGWGTGMSLETPVLASL